MAAKAFLKVSFKDLKKMAKEEEQKKVKITWKLDFWKQRWGFKKIRHVWFRVVH